VLLLFVGLLTLTGCNGCSSTPAAQLNQQAATAKIDALTPRLARVAKDHPDQAAEVQDIQAQWATAPERTTYTRVKPLMDQYVKDHPEDADGVSHVMASWDRRLTDFGV
jgi:hypothetical protein